ncbi:hypothetical protein DXG01_016167 [Tephrocybe rancida]|nr:hypothetical protein DXG01_016167 [Tephrocybe rancida]
MSPPSDTIGRVIDVKMTISSPTQTLDELMNTVISSRIMDPYVLVFKSRSIELHPLVMNSTPEPRPPAIHHFFPFESISFRDISISDYVVHQSCLTFSFLGYDFLRGVFRFEARIFSGIGGAGPAFEVCCVGIYPLSDNFNRESLHLFLSPPRGDFSSDMDASGWQNPSLVPNLPPGLSDTVRTSIRRAELNASSRGFVSAMAIGPEGKRAVWVERRRDSTMREILVWQKKEDERIEGNEDWVVMPRHMVYRVESYDLRGKS